MDLNNYLTEYYYVGRKFKLDLKISENIVDSFAKLTGDYSSLHTDDDYARKSMYKQTVIHGMISIAFIAGLNELFPEKCSISIFRISGRFLKPIFVDTALELEVSIAELDLAEAQIGCEFKVAKKESGSVFTTGTFGIKLTREIDVTRDANRFEVGKDSAETSMVRTELSESAFSFNEISKGDTDQFTFCIDSRCKAALYNILKSGVHRFALEPQEWVNRCDSNNLLATLMLSTFVGMCMPGRYAAFIDFNVGFENSITENQAYLLSGNVAFKSQSTSSIVETVAIRENTADSAVLASAKITTKVNVADIEIPSLESIAENDLDLGLKGNVALIAGGSGGIGRTIAKLLALHGVKVGINYYRSKEDADATVEEIADFGGKAISLKADISERSQVTEMVTSIKDTFGKPGILVNCAVAEFYPKEFLDLEWADFEREINVTVKGAFNCCQELLPLMIENGGGKIVNLSTVAAEYPPVNQSKYVAAKSALVGLTRSLAVEFSQFNIQINLVVPSLVKTNLTKHISDLFVEDIRRSTPMRRIASPTDVAKAVVYLASSLSSFTTGQKIMVTGGSAPFL